MWSAPAKLRTNSASAPAASASHPLLAIGWPQQSGRAIGHLAAEALEQLQRRDRHLREERVDVARHEQGHLHARVSSTDARRRHRPAR